MANRRKSLFGSAATPSSSKQQQQQTPQSGAATPSATTVAPLSDLELSRLFEETIRIATDNKINANNSWNLQLIDYFHDMTLLKEGDSINFQKASCTLDGCVKIYTSRVDNVDSETKRLLNGLVDNVGGDMDNDDEGGDAAMKKAKKTHTAGKTLEKDISNLNLKKLDLEFNVDPLFKKTSADFDEGGAKGLLLNHLSVGKDGRIVFDASEVQSSSAAEEAETATATAASDQRQQLEGESVSQGSLSVDMEKLKARFLDSMQSLWTRDVCKSLKTFRFSSKDSASSLFNPQSYLDSAQALFSQSSSSTSGLDNIEFNDVFSNDFDDDDDDGGGGGGGDMGDYDNMQFDNNPFNINNNAIPGILSEINHLTADARANGGQASGSSGGDGEDSEMARVITTDGNNGGEDGETGGDGLDMFSYFDKSLAKGWMGPEHWRPRRNATTPQDSSAQNDETGVGATAKKTRKRVEPVRIDFNADPIDLTSLFATGRATINLPKNAVRNNNLLPEQDYQFSSEQMVSLFMRPKWKASWQKMDGSRRRVQEVPHAETVEEEVEYWAEHAEHQPVFDEAAAKQVEPSSNDNQGGYDDYYDTDDDDEGIEAMPHPDMDDVLQDGGGGGSLFSSSSFSLQMNNTSSSYIDYGSQLVAEPKKVKAQHLSYARVAKKVDVKRLKDNIWKRVKDITEDHVEDESMDTTTQSQSQKDVTFTQIVHGLQPYYPEKKLKDISVAFCFICLLHLANEEGLEIEMPNRDALNQSNASMIMSNNTMDNITDPDASVIGMDDLTIHL